MSPETETPTEPILAAERWPKSVYRSYHLPLSINGSTLECICNAEGPKFWVGRVQYVPICITYITPPSAFSAEINPTVRVNAYNKRVVKVLMESSDDLGKLATYDIPNEEILILRQNFVKKNPYTKQSILAVPVELIKANNNMTELPTPNLLLKQLIDSNSEDVSSENMLRKMLLEAVDLLMRVGIPLNNLGIYGGIAAGIKHVHPNTIKDIDILVLGTEYTARLHELAEEQQIYKPNTNSIQNSRAKATDPKLQQLRHKNTRIWMPGEWFIDVRVIRRSTDNNRSLERTATCENKVTILQGVVRDASESMSNPMCFRLTLADGREVRVASLAYPFIGLVKHNQNIEVHCAATDVENYYMLVNPKTHTVQLIDRIEESL